MNEAQLHSLTTGTGSMVDAIVAAVSVVMALSVRPLRCLDREGPPWTWVAVCALMPTLWRLDDLVGNPLVPLLSLAPLLVLLTGWPLAVLSTAVLAAVISIERGLWGIEVLHRWVWAGLVPATLMLGAGAASRRWLPRHIVVYIFARGFFGTLIALLCSALLAAALEPVSSLGWTDRSIAMLLSAFSEAAITGMLVTALVAFRPKDLATYSDRLYLPP
jgi:uncharacterized membrane protein